MRPTIVNAASRRMLPLVAPSSNSTVAARLRVRSRATTIGAADPIGPACLGSNVSVKRPSLSVCFSACEKEGNRLTRTWGAGLSSGLVTVPLILMLEATTVPEVPSWMVMLVSSRSALPVDARPNASPIITPKVRFFLIVVIATSVARGHSCPMPLGIRMVVGELFPRSGPGAFEFGDIFLEGTNGARFGGAPFAAFGQTGLGDPAQ